VVLRKVTFKGGAGPLKPVKERCEEFEPTKVSFMTIHSSVPDQGVTNKTQVDFHQEDGSTSKSS